MKRVPTLACLIGVYGILWGASALAQPQTAEKASDTIIMVCHESGGSGLPLTDYINNMDVAIWDSASNSYKNVLPGLANKALTPVFNLETSSSPTQCAVATAELIAFYGLSLTQSFSHFTGYYIEIFMR